MPLPADQEAWVFGQCHSKWSSIGDRRVAVIQCEQGDLFGSDIVTDAGTVGYYHNVVFGAGHVAWSTAHMSEDRDRARRDGVSITPGTLTDGSSAAVVRIDWSHQDYREGSDGRDLVVVWRGPWTKHSDVVVCSIGEAPACSAPVRVDGHPPVSLRAGTLHVGKKAYAIGP
ncbi:MAG TPA: hypothetical protein VLB44_14580 [Kofleriaceae bacterium]|nr:hypothetical protein [Kofleriaceae bacterium]